MAYLLSNSCKKLLESGKLLLKLLLELGWYKFLQHSVEFKQPTVQKPPKSYEKVCETDLFLNKRLKDILLQKIPNFCLDSRTEYSMCALSRTPGLC